MIEPEVAMYWRRRAVAVAVVLGLVVVVVWAMSGPSEPSTEQAAERVGPGTNTAGFTELTEAPAEGAEGVPVAGEPMAPPSTPPAPGAQPPQSAVAPPPAAAVPPGSTPTQPRVGAAPTPSASPPVAVLPPRAASASASASASARPSALPKASGASASSHPSKSVQPSGSAKPQASGPSVPGAGAAAPGAAPGPALAACSDKALGVIAQVGATNYKVGQKPLFRLVIANHGDKPCTRDLDSGLQQLVVTSPDGKRVWDSNDCFPARKPDVRTLEPGKALVFPVSWAGRTSSPGCGTNREAVAAGTYHLTGKLGSLSSAPAPFVMTP